jgi:Vitamin K-dependent gamma-carboxylase
VALIYLNSGLWKLFGVSWRDGSAIYYATSLNIFHRFPGGIPSIEWPIVFGTYLTLLWEIGFAIMLFNKVTRRLALAVGILVHIGIWAALEVGLFSWFMLATYIAFVDPKAVSDFVARSLRFVKSRQQSRCADIVGVSAELGRPTL